MVLSGMRLAAGDSRASARQFSQRLGDESLDDRVVSIHRVRAGIRDTGWIAWAGIAATAAFRLCDLRPRVGHRFVRSGPKSSDASLQLVGSGCDVALLKIGDSDGRAGFILFAAVFADSVNLEGVARR